MAKDFYLKSAKAQLDAISVARAQAMTELEQARQSDDKFSGGAAAQQLADLAAAETNLRHLVDQYTASKAPPPPESPEIKAAKPVSQMHYGDVWEMANSGKYGVDENSFRAGITEAAKRRARGE